MEKSYEVTPIGIVESCYPDKFGTPRQPGLVLEALAKIKIFPTYQPESSLQGLEKFSHLWVIFYFHQNKDARFHAKVHPPRLEGGTMGVFATRSPHRPNSLGLSLMEIVKVEPDGVVVRGTDIISGTPVLDIKPYLPEVEAVPTAHSGWTQNVEKKILLISWETEALTQLESWSKKSARQELKNLIANTSRLDPRPTDYKGFEEGNSPYRNSHAVRFYEGDVHFTFVSAQQVKITKIIISAP